MRTPASIEEQKMAEAQAHADAFVPPEVTYLRPFKAGVTIDPEDGDVTFTFLLSPLKMVNVTVPAESGQAIFDKYTEEKAAASGLEVVKAPTSIIRP